ncbi:citrate/2-methylcitrate synthase [Bradyrhizobium sp. NAS80.1]|uniref:citrate/2-methylcitrate synthase n=1 Tax=Bradyrhizobium sp. NAS80.1 TaxID=1680159 RepID=UPI00143CC635|nr:citrate/2-methylcitrate synthase [Bradyrhizobium sp. NAS80.1]
MDRIGDHGGGSHPVCDGDAPNKGRRRSDSCQIGKALNFSNEWVEVVRRILVLSVDHGFSPSAYAVRTAASVGVTPYRNVAAGLALAAGRYSAFGRLDAMSRFIDELTAAPGPKNIIVRRLRAGEELPGFGAVGMPDEDPRAQALLAQLDKVCSRDEAFRRLKMAAAAVAEIKGLKPGFALPAMFVNHCGTESTGLQLVTGTDSGMGGALNRAISARPTRPHFLHKYW